MLYRDSQGRERREMTMPAIGGMSASGGSIQTIFISDPVAQVIHVEPGDANRRECRFLFTSPARSASDNRTDSYWNLQTSVALAQGVPIVDAACVAMALGALAVAGERPRSLGRGPRRLYKSSIGAEGPNVQVSGATSSSVSASTRTSSSLPAPVVTQLGTMTVAGIPAVGTRSTFTTPVGEIGNTQPIVSVSERWFSTDLQITVQSKHTDPRMGETDYSLTNLSRSEPDASLFQVPSGYTIKDGGPVFLSKPVQ